MKLKNKTRGKRFGLPLVAALGLVFGSLSVAGPAYANPCTASSPDTTYACALAGYTAYTGTWADTRYIGGNHNCTRYAAYRLAIRGVSDQGTWGDAQYWDTNVASAGYPVNGTAAVGSIAQWEDSVSHPGGHVAHVDAVGNDWIEVSDDSWGGVTRSGIVINTAGDWPNNFLHIKDIGTASLNLYSFDRQGAGTNSTEVHVLNGSNFGQFLVHSGTALGQTDADWDFLLADYNGDGVKDIYAIDRTGTGSNSTEVHVINGANYNQFLLHTDTALGQTDADYAFQVADYNGNGTPDVYAIDRTGTGSNSTEVHVLNGNNWGQFLLHTGTALGQTDADYQFVVADYNGNGTPDIYAIDRTGTGSNSTEVHVLNGGNWGQFLLHTGTGLQQTDPDWSFKVADYNSNGTLDVYAIDSSGTGSNSTEVHVINGNSWGTFLLRIGTALQQTTVPQWSFN